MNAEEATPDRPIYSKKPHLESVTPFYFITCNDGWRESVVCTGMYGWAADWLIDILQGRPFTPKGRP